MTIRLNTQMYGRAIKMKTLQQTQNELIQANASGYTYSLEELHQLLKETSGVSRANTKK